MGNNGHCIPMPYLHSLISKKYTRKTEYLAQKQYIYKKNECSLKGKMQVNTLRNPTSREKEYVLNASRSIINTGSS